MCVCVWGGEVYFYRDQIKKNEMDGACGKRGRQERCIQGFDAET